MSLEQLGNMRIATMTKSGVAKGARGVGPAGGVKAILRAIALFLSLEIRN